VKVDEDLPRRIVDLLDARGYEAATVVQQGWQGIPDDVLWPLVQGERRWLMTADKGFADLRRYPLGSHAGVILLRAGREGREAALELAAQALDRLSLDVIPAALVVVTPRGVRVRRARRH
jgi:predicted nuclease of predicted toxin-antitoxin system